ncbi:MAG: hypothetical protein EVA89_19670 [Sandaracinaceae bacterium]|nr:MAG: hypothetical protein EVA89_19670 [Sandaracinaceae bacterium]
MDAREGRAGPAGHALALRAHAPAGGHHAAQSLYATLGPAYPVFKALTPDSLTTAPDLGRAMIRVAHGAHPLRSLEGKDIIALGA